jgi:hypothetical protein
MDSIRVGSQKWILINDDPNRVVVFDPSDMVFAEKFYALQGEMAARQAEFEARAKALDANQELDGNGMPANAREGIAFVRDVCEFMRAQIDKLFGAGTSQTVFGDAMSLDAITQFVEGITPFIHDERAAKVQKYVNTAVKPKRPKHR